MARRLWPAACLLWMNLPACSTSNGGTKPDAAADIAADITDTAADTAADRAAGLADARLDAAPDRMETLGDAAPRDDARSDGRDASTPDGGGASLGGPFVAVGYAAVRGYSLDGKSWTRAVDPGVLPAGWTGPPVAGDNQWLLRGGCWGQGKFLAVGGTGGDQGLMLSTPSNDGQSWALVGGTQANEDCSFGNGVWVTPTRWSLDGTNWTTLNQGTTAREIAFGAGLFVAVGDNGVAYSRDGKAWTNLAITFVGTGGPFGGYNRVAFGNGRFLAINTVVNTAPIFEWDAVSDTSFTERPHPAELAGVTMYDIAYGRRAFYVAGFGSMYRLADGAGQWQVVQGTGASELYNLIVTDDLFVDERWWSTDGARWTAATNPPSNISYGITKIIATPR